MADFRDFLGRGWNFAVKVDNEGGVATSAFEKNVEQSIEIIIGTAPGERVMRPEYGCKIHELVFSAASAATCNLASLYVKEALLFHEPRIKGLTVETEVDQDHDNQLNLRIKYTVRATNNSFNKVYPFYLRREEDL